MSGIIRITPDSMHERAGQYRSESDKIADCIAKMDSLLNTLKGEWEGSASEAYADRFQQELRPGFVSAQQLVSEIATALDSTAEALNETDQAIAAQFRG